MPRAFVTGATGFIGLNLIERLTRDGWDVLALHRAESDLTFLSRFEAERVVGDVTDHSSLTRSMPEGVDVVFHLAASVNFWSKNNDRQTTVNVEGTRNVVDVALRKEAKRFIQASSFVAFGPADGDLLHEGCDKRGRTHWVNYFRTKALADDEVMAGIERGLHACFLAPGYVLGPYELNNFSKLFLLLKEGKLPGAFPGGGPWCHVRSVVDAFIGATEVAEPGERYLIGSVHATFAEVAARIAQRLGVAPPRTLPASLLRAVARVMQWFSHFTGKEPDVTPEVAHMFSMDVAFDCTKAARELGYHETSLDEMIDDTHAWLLAEGRI